MQCNKLLNSQKYKKSTLFIKYPKLLFLLLAFENRSYKPKNRCLKKRWFDWNEKWVEKTWGIVYYIVILENKVLES